MPCGDEDGGDDDDGDGDGESGDGVGVGGAEFEAGASKESKASSSRDDEEMNMMMMMNQVGNFSYGDAEALTDEIEEASQIVDEVFRIKEILLSSEEEVYISLFH